MVDGPPTTLPIVSPKFHRVRITVPGEPLIPPGAGPTPDDKPVVDEGPDPIHPGLGIYWHNSALETLSFNMAPDNPDFLERHWLFWKSRTVDSITGISIHHAGGDWSLQAIADYQTNPYDGGKTGRGYPWMQYHWFVRQAPPHDVILCAPLTWGMWNDHTNIDDINYNIAICMQGRWDNKVPPVGQIQAVTKLCSWLMWKYNISIDEVQGHTERAGLNDEGRLKTVCPGWNSTAWKDQFYQELEQQRRLLCDC
jgi:hypothetical protein